MTALRAFLIRFGNLFQRDRCEAEMAMELEAHLQMQIAENVRSGMNSEAARLAALRECGGLDQAKEECRDARGLAFLESLCQDIRYGVRMLRKSPGFTAVAVLSLALGIGANTAIFSVINAVLLKPLPFNNPDRVLMISHEWAGQSGGSISAPTFTMYRDQTRSFDEIALVGDWSANLTGWGEPEQVTGFKASADFFPCFGVAPLLGRTFDSEDDRPGANHVVVLSNGFWKRRFGSDPNLIGRTISLDGIGYKVLGIMPQGFEIPRDVELWTPIAFTPDQLSDDQAGNGSYVGLARLRAGTSIQQAQAEMDAIAPRVQQRFPQEFNPKLGWAIRLSPLREVLVGNIRLGLLILFGTVVFVLLIGCANVASLLLERAIARQHEIAIRMSTGAGRSRIVRQLLTEGILLALIGGALGVLISFSVVPFLMTAIPADTSRFLPNWNAIAIDNRALAFTGSLCLITVALFGLTPALVVSSGDLARPLKEEGRSSTGTIGRNRIRNFLVVFEIALAFVLLVGSGLLIRSFVRVVKVNPGFHPQRVLTMSLSLPKIKYPNTAEMTLFWQRLIQDLEAVPGVESAGVTNRLPLTFGNTSGSFYIEGIAAPGTLNPPHAEYRTVSSNYFLAVGIPLRKGRFFTDQDTSDSTPVAIIDESVARQYWPNGDAIGKRLASNPVLEGSYGHALWRQIVGIVGHVQSSGLDSDSGMQLYIPSAQFLNPHFVPNSMSLVVRTGSDPMSMLPTIERTIHRTDDDEPVNNPRTFEQIISESLTQRRLSMLLVLIFAAIALILTVVGIYGVVSYSVAQRTHEIGIRVALGTTRAGILNLIVGQGLRLALLGIAIGLAASLALTRFMASLLFGVSATDPATFAGVALLLVLVALLASYIPARRATRIDPIRALRTE